MKHVIHKLKIDEISAVDKPVQEHARALIAAFEAAKADGRGALAFEGRMVDEPVVARARALIERA